MRIISYYDSGRNETVWEIHISDFEMVDLAQNKEFMSLLRDAKGEVVGQLHRTAHLVSLIDKLELESIDQTKYTSCHCHLPQVHGHEPDCPEYGK